MATSKFVSIIIAVAVAAVGAGLFVYQKQPSTTPDTPDMPAAAPAPQIPAEFQDVAERAADLVASTLHVSPDEVTVLSVQRVTWSDASLGCPEPGMMYAQVLTPGYLVTTQVNGQTQNVHMNDKGKGRICPPEQARPPAQTE